MPTPLVFVVPNDKVQSKINEIAKLTQHSNCPKNLRIHLPTITAEQATTLVDALIHVYWESLWVCIKEPQGNDVYLSMIFSKCLRGDHLFLSQNDEHWVASSIKAKKEAKETENGCGALIFSSIFCCVPFIKSIQAFQAPKDLSTKPKAD